MVEITIPKVGDECIPAIVLLLTVLRIERDIVPAVIGCMIEDRVQHGEQLSALWHRCTEGRAVSLGRDTRSVI